MNRASNFIDRQVFEAVLSDVPRKGGGEYQDVNTIYGDLSRLVVAWLACTPHEQLQTLYNELGWEGNANARAFHMAARRWLEQHHPGRCPVVTDSA
jgi:hypothetical protein